MVKHKSVRGVSVLAKVRLRVSCLSKKNMKNRLPQMVYTADSQLRQPGQFLRSMCHDLRACPELAWRLFRRNISSQYRQSILGYLWAFIPSIITTLLWVFLKSQRIFSIGPTGIPYPAYVIVGVVLWQGFVEALMSPIKMTNSSKSMLAKINFPREALLLAGAGEVLFNLSIRFTLIFFVFIWYGIGIPSTLYIVPFGVVAIVALGFAIGIPFAPLGLLYQDTGRGLEVIARLGFFVTPVIYPPPQTWPASLLSQVNPVSPLLITTREWLTTGTASNMGGFLLILGIILISVIAGWIFFRLAIPYVIERVSA